MLCCLFRYPAHPECRPPRRCRWSFSPLRHVMPGRCLRYGVSFSSIAGQQRCRSNTHTHIRVTAAFTTHMLLRCLPSRPGLHHVSLPAAGIMFAGGRRLPSPLSKKQRHRLNPEGFVTGTPRGRRRREGSVIRTNNRYRAEAGECMEKGRRHEGHKEPHYM